jgi:hypothetical protein
MRGQPSGGVKGAVMNDALAREKQRASVWLRLLRPWPLVEGSWGNREASWCLVTRVEWGRSLAVILLGTEVSMVLYAWSSGSVRVDTISVSRVSSAGEIGVWIGKLG